MNNDPEHALDKIKNNMSSLLNLILKATCFFLMVLLLPCFVFSQDSVVLHSESIGIRYTSAVQKKMKEFDGNLDKYSARTIEKLIRNEKKMQAKISKIDSLKAKQLFGYAIDSLNKFKAIIKQKAFASAKVFSTNYVSYLDTLKQSLSFYKKGKDAADAAQHLQGKLDSCVNSVNAVEARLATFDQINGFITQRSAVLQSQIGKFSGIAGNLKAVEGQAFYYKSQVEQYKRTLQEPEKIEQIVLTALRHTADFRQYMAQHSELASIFSAPSSAIPGLGLAPAVNGLPSRATLQQFMDKNVPGTGTGAIDKIRQQVADAGTARPADPKSEAESVFKEKLNNVSSNGNPTPPGLNSNSQHGRRFGRRLEFGTNIQFGGTTQYLPSSGTVGLQLGYRLSEKCSMGVGASYTFGMGKDWNHIELSNQAVGWRTYFKLKLKNSLFVQASGEWNYLTSFTSISQLKRGEAWQPSALIGGGKEFKVSKKVTGSLQLLYDALWDHHFPTSRPLIFRMGYNL
jgi:hypothetical protein